MAKSWCRQWCSLENISWPCKSSNNDDTGIHTIAVDYNDDTGIHTIAVDYDDDTGTHTIAVDYNGDTGIHIIAVDYNDASTMYPKKPLLIL